MGNVTVSGIASGMDTDGIISQLVALERRPIDLIEKRIAQHELRQQAVAALGTTTSAVSSAANTITSSMFDDIDINSGNESVVTATGSGKAVPGGYSVEVSQLAKAHRLAGSGFADVNSTGVASEDGTLVFSVGPDGDDVTIDVSANMTLGDLADAINGSVGDVTASIIGDGSQSNSFRLVLTSKVTGLSGDITISNNDTTINFADKTIDVAEVGAANADTYTGTITSGGTYTGTGSKSFILEVMTAGKAGVATYRFSTDGGLTWNDNDGEGHIIPKDSAEIGGEGEGDGVEIQFEDDGTSFSVGDRFTVDAFDPLLQSSQDAVVEVDGITITSASNTVADIIPGVTLELKGTNAGSPTNVKVNDTFTSLVGKVEEFVTAWNAFSGFVNEQSQYDLDTKTAGILSGDAATRGIKQTMRRLMTQKVNLGAGVPDSLAVLGITGDKTGTLTLDSSVLNAALAEDKEAVQRVFLDFGKPSTSKIIYDSQDANTEAGVHSVELYDTGDGTIGVKINGVAAEVVGEQITGATGSSAEGLVFSIENLQNQSTGSFGSIEITKGVFSEMGRAGTAITHNKDGVIAGKKASIDRSIETLNKQIERQEERIEMVQSRLRRQFTDLEVLMGKLQSQSDFIMQQIAAFNKDD